MRERVKAAIFISLAIIVFDQATKYVARTNIGPYETIRLLPVLNLVNVQNKGAAFGMFRDFGNIFFIIVSSVAIIVMSWVIAAGKDDHRLFALLAGGAAGNLIDRVVLGHVVDFIDFTVAGYHWPAFNVADSALTIGMAIMFLGIFRRPH
jgi:signal peptidase II